VILRLYEAGGEPTEGVRVTFAVRVVADKEVNLIEDQLHAIDMIDKTIQLNFRSFEIKTIKLVLG
jgi:alpha-mannosidase